MLFELNNCDLQTDIKKIKGHSLSKLWGYFKAIAVKDSRLLICYKNIDPILKSLDAADPDAQDFRYPIGNAQNGNAPRQTLLGKRIVDLVTVREMVMELQNHLEDLYLITEIVVQERLLGSFTQDLNRDELKRLALDCGNDKTPYLAETKEKWKKSHKLSNHAFVRATDFIAQHREFAGYSGTETDLIAIPSELLDKIVAFKIHELAQKQHQTQERKHNCIVTFEEIKKDITKEPISFEAYRLSGVIIFPSRVISSPTPLGRDF